MDLTTLMLIIFVAWFAIVVAVPLAHILKELIDLARRG